jgi:tetratricopeptide (TPR) repeat protein
VTTISQSLTVAVKHHQAGELQLAEQIYQQVLRADPGHADALHLLGVMAHQVGNHDLAVERIRRAIASNPHTAAFHSNLGSAYNALGRLDEAVASYHRALEIEPGFAQAHNNLGNTLKNQGKLDDAVASYGRALQIAPDYAEACNNLGNALRELGKLDEALTSYQRALQIAPNYPEAYNNWGNALRDLGKLDEAEASYRRALQIKPDYADAFGNLAGLYERLNRLEEATATADEGLRVSPHHPLVNLAVAKCQERERRYQEAIDRLVRIRPFARPESDVAKEISFQLAQLYDRAGDPPKAFDHFTEANRMAMQAAGDVASLQEQYFQSIDVLEKAFSESSVDAWSPAPAFDGGETPVFLVGFARSGTTLLNVILDAHPRIQTLDEKPTILSVLRAVESLPGGFAHAIPRLSPEQFGHLRTTYFRAVADCVERRPGHVLVDVNPMNTVEIGLILRVFPSARFLVALRHPYDVCLSCFMQDFKTNGATVHFFTLEHTALAYAKVMSLWQQYLRVLPHPHHVVRYEDLVDGFEGEIRRLLRFLNVEWDDAVLDYAEHARRRGMIHTPSYRQVTEPIYKRARYRWRRYAGQLAPIMSALEPYVERFGYQHHDPPADARSA